MTMLNAAIGRHWNAMEDQQESDLVGPGYRAF